MDKRTIHIVALITFKGKLNDESAMLDETFEILGACVEKLEQVNALWSWITGHTLMRAGSTSLSLYKMILDGRLSERRELMDSMIECLELLIYIGNRSHRRDEALHAKSPAASETANRSREGYELLKKSLRSRAVRLGFSHESLRQIIHLNYQHWRTDQPPDLENLKARLETINRFLIRSIIEGAHCLGLVPCTEASIFFEKLQAHIEQSHAVFSASREENILRKENMA